MEASKGKWSKLPKIDKLKNIVLCGMGGSAISGDLLNCYVQDEIAVPILVNRKYEVPKFVDQNSIVFISSYSGNTEEVLSAYKEAITRTSNILCITSGGEIERLNPNYIFKIPKGYPPRGALGWLFIPLILALEKLNIIKTKNKEIEETISLLKKFGEEFKLNNSTPYRLANKLVEKLPIIYSDQKFFPIAMRWVTQLNENSKQLAHYNVFSELNHNEVVGFGEPNIKTFLIILKDKKYNSRINMRIELTKKLYSPYTEIQEIEAYGDSLLARIFYLIYFGDWVSYWLAVIKGVDPMPVKRIDWLKRELKNI
jgi:glucose/mannose-6-phosphate isomerase